VSCRRSADDLDDDDCGAGDAVDVAADADDTPTVSLRPHVMQNLAPGRFDAPHDGQPIGIGAPHSSQKWLSSGRLALQLGHSMPRLGLSGDQRITEVVGGALVWDQRIPR
jgi:hypothetical protein